MQFTTPMRATIAATASLPTTIGAVAISAGAGSQSLALPLSALFNTAAASTACGRRGDFDNDNQITPADIAPFVYILLHGPANSTDACKADLNQDTQTDAADIQRFVDCVTGGPCP